MKTSQRSLDYYFKVIKETATNPNFRNRALPTNQLSSCLAGTQIMQGVNAALRYPTTMNAKFVV